MADVKVRGLDAWVVDRLKERANANARSLEAELRAVLTESAGGMTFEQRLSSLEARVDLLEARG